MTDLKQRQFNDAFKNALIAADSQSKIHAVMGKPDGTLYYVDFDNVQHLDLIHVTMNDPNTSATGTRVVRCKKVLPQWGLNVILRYDTDGVLEVTEEDTNMSGKFSGGRNFNTPAHAWAHQIFGPDPVFLSGLNLLPLLSHPTPTPSLSIVLEPYAYQFEGVNKYWAGGEIDLTGYYSAIGGTQAFVIICLDPSSNLPVVVNGVGVTPFTPYDPDGLVLFDGTDVAAIDTSNYIRSAAIRLYMAQTRIIWSDIFADLKAMAGGSSSTTLSGDNYTTRLFFGA